MPTDSHPNPSPYLIHDLVNAELDITATQDRYGLSPEALSHWALEESNRAQLMALCYLTDIQTQLLINRFRPGAAGRLFELATQKGDTSKAALELARRASVDLLKLELPRADPGPTRADAAGPGHSLRLLHELIRADDDTDSPLQVTSDSAQNTIDPVASPAGRGLG